ncbi:MAG: hypothetical protein ACPG80_01675 [Rickettsiales bacterium]
MDERTEYEENGLNGSGGVNGASLPPVSFGKNQAGMRPQPSCSNAAVPPVPPTPFTSAPKMEAAPEAEAPAAPVAPQPEAPAAFAEPLPEQPAFSAEPQPEEPVSVTIEPMSDEAPTLEPSAPPAPEQIAEPVAATPEAEAAPEPAPEPEPVPTGVKSFSAAFPSAPAPTVSEPLPPVEAEERTPSIAEEDIPTSVSVEAEPQEQETVETQEAVETVATTDAPIASTTDSQQAINETLLLLEDAAFKSASGKTRMQTAALKALLKKAHDNDDDRKALFAGGFKLMEKLADGVSGDALESLAKNAESLINTDVISPVDNYRLTL